MARFVMRAAARDLEQADSLDALIAIESLARDAQNQLAEYGIRCKREMGRLLTELKARGYVVDQEGGVMRSRDD
jgi:hypothetical protein